MLNWLFTHLLPRSPSCVEPSSYPHTPPQSNSGYASTYPTLYDCMLRLHHEKQIGIDPPLALRQEISPIVANFFFSPFSLDVLMGIIYLGSKGESYKEIRNLYFGGRNLEEVEDRLSSIVISLGGLQHAQQSGILDDEAGTIIDGGKYATPASLILQGAPVSSKIIERHAMNKMLSFKMNGMNILSSQKLLLDEGVNELLLDDYVSRMKRNCCGEIYAYKLLKDVDDSEERIKASINSFPNAWFRNTIRGWCLNCECSFVLIGLFQFEGKWLKKFETGSSGLSTQQHNVSEKGVFSGFCKDSDDRMKQKDVESKGKDEEEEGERFLKVLDRVIEGGSIRCDVPANEDWKENYSSFTRVCADGRDLAGDGGFQAAIDRDDARCVLDLYEAADVGSGIANDFFKLNSDGDLDNREDISGQTLQKTPNLLHEKGKVNGFPNAGDAGCVYPQKLVSFKPEIAENSLLRAITAEKEELQLADFGEDAKRLKLLLEERFEDEVSHSEGHSSSSPLPSTVDAPDPRSAKAAYSLATSTTSSTADANFFDLIGTDSTCDYSPIVSKDEDVQENGIFWDCQQFKSLSQSEEGVKEELTPAEYMHLSTTNEEGMVIYHKKWVSEADSLPISVRIGVLPYCDKRIQLWMFMVEEPQDFFRLMKEYSSNPPLFEDLVDEARSEKFSPLHLLFQLPIFELFPAILPPPGGLEKVFAALGINSILNRYRADFGGMFDGRQWVDYEAFLSRALCRISPVRFDTVGTRVPPTKANAENESDEGDGLKASPSLNREALGGGLKRAAGGLASCNESVEHSPNDINSSSLESTLIGKSAAHSREVRNFLLNKPFVFQVRMRLVETEETVKEGNMAEESSPRDALLLFGQVTNIGRSNENHRV